MSSEELARCVATGDPGRAAVPALLRTRAPAGGSRQGAPSRSRFFGDFFGDLMGNSKKEPLKMVILCDFHGDSNGLIWENQLLLFFGLNRDDHGMIGEYCTRIM